MTNDKLSDIEIKLINATRKFAEANIMCAQADFFKGISVIGLMEPGQHNFNVWVVYSNDQNEQEIIGHTNENNPGYTKNLYEKYTKFLKQEIPEIKDRIVIKD